MSIITVLALAFAILLFVVVLAACTSFAGSSPAEVDLPDGDWVGAAALSHADRVKAAASPAPSMPRMQRPLKMHSWI